jgi:ferredoxin-nitrite reductase
MGEGYTITIGGSQGANPTLGELHQKAVPAAQIKSVLKNLLIEQFGATTKTYTPPYNSSGSDRGAFL